MNVVGYARVSLDTAVDDVLDRDAQESAIRGWARTNGHRVDAVFCDEGFTASSGLETRLALADALESIRSGETKGLIVARLERLAVEIIVQEQLGEDIERMGGVLFSADRAETQEALAADPTRRIIRDVLGATRAHHLAMRELWVRQRVRKFPVDGENEEAAMIRIEQLAEQGMDAREISLALSAEGYRPKLSRVFDLAGLRRLIEILTGKEQRGRG
jgi:hypothetical protein